jgi:hypothetical protein
LTWIEEVDAGSRWPRWVCILAISAEYSDLSVESDISVCIWDRHRMGHPPSVMM